MSRKETLDEIDQLLKNHCKTCEITKLIEDKHGYRNSQVYCLEICKVGRSLQRLGENLEGKAGLRRGQELEKHTYLNLSKQGSTDIEIAELYGIGVTTLGRRKKEWGVKKPKTHKTEADYNRKREMGYTDKEISLAWSMRVSHLNKMKRKWSNDSDDER